MTVCNEMVAVMEPQEIEDEGHEQILERVAAVDVAKASGMVCVRVPREDQPGRRRTRVRQVEATSGAVLELADHLVRERVQKVTLESASDYWRPGYTRKRSGRDRDTTYRGTRSAHRQMLWLLR